MRAPEPIDILDAQLLYYPRLSSANIVEETMEIQAALGDGSLSSRTLLENVDGLLHIELGKVCRACIIIRQSLQLDSMLSP
jgi:hypothetical protein